MNLHPDEITIKIRVRNPRLEEKTKLPRRGRHLIIVLTPRTTIIPIGILIDTPIHTAIAGQQIIVNTTETLGIQKTIRGLTDHRGLHPLRRLEIRTYTVLESIIQIEKTCATETGR